MAYQTYITEALICGSRARNTSDRSYLLFAREAGMLYATAKSVREERSKQRFALQEFSYVRATLIHGKGGWRIAGVEPIMSIYAHAETREARTFIRNIIRLLRRTMQGETPHEALFDDVVRVLIAPGTEHLVALEQVLSLRILFRLGYVAPHTSYEHLLNDADVFMHARTMNDELAALCTETIDHALTQSQL